LFAPNAVLSMLVDTYARVAGRNGHVSHNGHHPWANFDRIYKTIQD
jgi:hypothetical protein